MPRRKYSAVSKVSNEMEAMAQKAHKPWTGGKGISDWKLVIHCQGMLWHGVGWTSSLWYAKTYQCMGDAREDFAEARRHCPGHEIEVKRVRMFIADRDPKHVHPPDAP